MPVPPVTDWIPDKVQQTLTQLLHRDTMQLLEALGYPSEGENEADSLQTAIAQFRADLNTLPIEAPSAQAWIEEQLPMYLPEWDPDAPPTCDEAELLALLCDTENPLDLALLPENAASGLRHRIQHHRQRSLQLDQKPSRNPFKALADLLDEAAEPATLRLLRATIDRMGRCLGSFIHPPEFLTESQGHSIHTRFGPGFSPITTITGFPSEHAIEVHTAKVTHCLAQIQAILHAIQATIRWAATLGTQPLSWFGFGLQLAKQMQQFAHNAASRTTQQA